MGCIDVTSVYSENEGNIQSFAGTGVGGYKDGPTESSQFNSPYGMLISKLVIFMWMIVPTVSSERFLKVLTINVSSGFSFEL